MYPQLSEQWKDAVKSDSPSLPIMYLEVEGKKYSGELRGVLDSVRATMVAETFIGGFNMLMFEVNIFCLGIQEEVANFEGKLVNIYAGYDTTEFISKNNLIIDEIEFNENQTNCKVTIVDRASLFDVVYKPLTLPAKGSEIIDEICIRHGITRTTEKNLIFDDFEFKVINVDEDGTVSYRQLINAYAQINGVMAVITREGHLGFVDVLHGEKVDYTITSDNYDYIKVQTKVGEINSLKVARTDTTGEEDYDYYVLNDQDSIDVNGMTQVRMSSNPFVDLIIEDVLQMIFDNIKGFSYYPFEIKGWKPNFALEQGDIIEIVDVEGNKYLSPYMNMSLNYAGGSLANISTDILPETLPVYELDSIISDIKRTEIKTDKNKQQINATITKIEGYESKFSDFQQQLDNFKFTVQKGGGANLVKNSVGYGANQTDFWNVKEGSTISAEKNSWNLQHIAKHGWLFSGNSLMYQDISLQHDEDYTFSCNIYKNNPQGTIKITLTEILSNSQSLTHTIFENTHGSTYDGKVEFSFKPTSNEIRLGIETTDVQNQVINIDDVMISLGNLTVWQQANGETYTVMVKIDEKGVLVKNVDGKGYTTMTPEEFAIYYDNEKLFTANKDWIEITKLIVREGVQMRPIMFVQNHAQPSVDVVWIGE